MAPAEHERHRREEAERRAKRKASKSSKSESQREKDRKRREHTQRVLEQQNKGKKQKTSGQSPGGTLSDTSAFEALFNQRAQGFKIEFAFRNAPPRPPVGPCFVGSGLEGQLQDYSQYRPLNAVEVNYSWKLHAEPDLGVPLAPSAMDLKCYQKPSAEPSTALDPNDEALLDWKGSMGDTAGEELQKRRDRARAAARRALAGKAGMAATTLTPSSGPTKKKTKVEFSRVLDENLPNFMKKTTYLANDYSRKVHDFTSLAKTKQKTVKELESRQEEMELGRSSEAIARSFTNFDMRHPTKKNLKPVSHVPLLPNIQHWGNAHTHVVVDKPPKGQDENIPKLSQAFIANVAKRQANARMTCQLMIPTDGEEQVKEGETSYHAAQLYDLDVVPLKEEDEPNVNFAVFLSDTEATYLPISSRVQLSVGRPAKKASTCFISRREPTEQETRDFDERVAELDEDVEKKMSAPPTTPATKVPAAEDKSDDDAMDVDTPTQAKTVEDDSSDEKEANSEIGPTSAATIAAEG